MAVDEVDAVVVGSGPNGLVAAALLARAGWSVTVLERADVAGGAVRSEALTVPGNVHDTFSAFYGLLHASPVHTELQLDRRVRWASFDVPVSASVAPDSAAVCHADLAATAAGLSALHPGDGEAWSELAAWWVDVGRRFLDVVLWPPGSVRPTLRLLRAAGLRGAAAMAQMLLAPVDAVAQRRFRSEPARALLASGATHGDLSVATAGSTPAALVLAMAAQDVNMPVPVGGAGRLADALVACVTEAGGTVVTGRNVTKVSVEAGRAVAVETAAGEVVRARRAVLADLPPGPLFHQLVGQEHLRPDFLERLTAFRHGSGVFKVDLALDGPVPWLVEDLRRCGVVHLTGDLGTMVRSAAEVHRDALPAAPLLVVGQQSLVDSTRAPAGGHTLWVETHVPSSPRADGFDERPVAGWSEAGAAFTDRVLDRLEEHAPGLRSRIVGLATHSPVELEEANPNLVGGDLGGGSAALDQQLVFRPVPGWSHYATPVRGLYLCSASAHPGGGVHGMVGRNCARRVLRDARLSRDGWRRR